MTVEVPVGCTATVCVPDAKAPSAVRTDGTGKKDGNIVYNGMKDDYAEYTVRSGKIYLYGGIARTVAIDGNGGM